MDATERRTYRGVMIALSVMILIIVFAVASVFASYALDRLGLPRRLAGAIPEFVLVCGGLWGVATFMPQWFPGQKRLTAGRRLAQAAAFAFAWVAVTKLVSWAVERWVLLP